MSVVPAIRVVEDVDVVRITLARPPSNLLDLPMLVDLGAAFESAAQRPALKAVALTAEADTFCAGVDVGEQLGDGDKAMFEAFVAVFQALRTLPCPTVAAVRGPALGAGAELATFCDVVIAGHDATFGQPEIGRGRFAPIAALHYPWRVGPARALRLLLTGETLDATEALRIGLVDRVVPPDTLADALERELRGFRGMSAPVLALTKRAVRETHGRPFDEALSVLEEIYHHHLMTTADAEEGLRAFMDGRKPVWRDR